MRSLYPRFLSNMIWANEEKLCQLLILWPFPRNGHERLMVKLDGSSPRSHSNALVHHGLTMATSTFAFHVSPDRAS